MKDNAFDLIHCDILSLAYTICQAGDVPVILTDHDVSYLKSMRIARGSPFPLNLFLYLETRKVKGLESRVFNGIALGVVVSGTDKERLEKLCPGGRFEVIENGVDIEQFHSDYDALEPETLSWVGGFGHYPNKEGIYYFLDDVYPLIKEKVPGVKLSLVGGGITERLRKEAAGDSTIELAGFVDDPIPYMQRGAVFIAPILSGSGTRLKIIEAMAAGKAIVTTSVGCEGIEGVDGRDYLVGDTPREFAERTARAVTDTALRDSLGRNARALAESRYDWKVICEKMDAIYREFARDAEMHGAGIAAPGVI